MSKLENYLSKELYTRFGQYSIRQNYRPDWMEGLELDFYIDELRLAAEVQGDQHYEFIEFFHKDHDHFKSQLARDSRKRLICTKEGIKLVEIFNEKDADLFILRVKELSHTEEPRYVYQSERKPLSHRERHPNDFSIIKNSESARRKRILKCEQNLYLYNCGLLSANEEKARKWQEVIENNGYEKSFGRITMTEEAL